MKICKKCNIEKQNDLFHKNNKTKDKLCSWCKECASEYAKQPDRRKYQKNYRESEARKNSLKRFRDSGNEKKSRQNFYSKNENKLKRKDYLLKITYNISLEIYNKILNEQQFKCKTCNISLDELKNFKFKNLVVDHNHKTGEVRGLLCNNCNRALGYIKENKNTLENMIKYLS